MRGRDKSKQDVGRNVLPKEFTLANTQEYNGARNHTHTLKFDHIHTFNMLHII